MQNFFRRIGIVLLIASVFLGRVQAETLRRIEQADFGITQDGSEVKLITLRNSKGMSAQIISYGAIIKDIQPIFRDVLDLPDLQLSRQSNASNVEGWDSLAHVNLVMAIEKRYKIKIALGELQDLKNVGEMADLIQKKLAK